MILLPGLYVCVAHVLMRFCHLINGSFVCKAKERRLIRNCNNIDDYWIKRCDVIKDSYKVGVRDRMVVGFLTTCAISAYHH